jgi:hypothetical protein
MVINKAKVETKKRNIEEDYSDSFEEIVQEIEADSLEEAEEKK